MKAFTVDLDRCTGCYACEIACKDENDLAPGVRRVKVKTVEAGKYNRFYVPIFALDKRGVGGCTLCPQLQREGRRPACINNCLTNALFYGDAEEMADKAKQIRSETMTDEHNIANVYYASSKPIPEDILKE